MLVSLVLYTGDVQEILTGLSRSYHDATEFSVSGFPRAARPDGYKGLAVLVRLYCPYPLEEVEVIGREGCGHGIREEGAEPVLWTKGGEGGLHSGIKRGAGRLVG